MANVTEMDPPETDEIDDSTEDFATPKPTPASKPERKRKGRPARGQGRTPDVRQPQFFDSVAAVPKEDWGNRAFMYVYADEPVCNKKTFGESRYLLKSSAPILDLEGLKQDYGSFKGWMSLNLRKSGKDATDEVDRLNFEIYDPKHPPKIPRSAWANDARNKRWLDLLPPEAPTPSAAAGSLIESIKVYKEIRDEVKDEMEPPATDEEPSNRTRETLETMKLAKELFGTPAATTPAADPLQIAVSLATTMMQMKADNPVIDMYRDELKALRDELKEERAEQRKLQAAPAAPQKSLVDMALEFLPMVEKLEPLKKLFGWGSGNGTPAAAVVENSRPARMGTLDFMAEILPKLFESPLANAVAQKIITSTQAPINVQPQGAGMQQPRQQPAIPQPGPDPFLQWIDLAGTPAMMEYFMGDSPGGDFAEWVYFGRPDFLPRLQAFKHPLMPVVAPGIESIIEAYKHIDEVWKVLGPRETEFRKFITEFCEWKSPEEDDEPQAPGPDEDGWTQAAPNGRASDVSERGERVS